MKIAGCEMVPLSVEESRSIDGLQVVGRARLTPEAGGLIHALVLWNPSDGKLSAVYLNRHTGCFETFAIEDGRD